MNLLRILSMCVVFALSGCDNQDSVSEYTQNSNFNKNLSITISKSLEDFHNISFEGNIIATINQSTDKYSYLIAEQRTLDTLNISVRDHTLYIKAKKPLRHNKQIPIVRIQSHSLTKIATQGSTKIDITSLDTEYLNILNKGSSKYNITGNISQLDIDTIGAILINGKTLKTKNSKIQSKGVCHVIFEVTENLQIFSNGFNKILYSGNPNIDNQGTGYNIIKPISQINHEIT